MSGLPLVVVSRATLCCGEQAAHCGGFSRRRAQAVGAQAPGPAVYGLGGGGAQAYCFAMCGIFPDRGSSPCSLR